MDLVSAFHNYHTFISISHCNFNLARGMYELTQYVDYLFGGVYLCHLFYIIHTATNGL